MAAELARQEADRVEAEEPEPEPSEPDEPEPEPDEPEPPADVEALLQGFDEKALESEQKRHEKALDKIFGGLEAFDPCEHCGGLGIAPKGLEAQPEPVQNPKLVRCDECKGLGVMATGSLHPQYQLEPCMVCNGHGYRDREAIEASDRARALAEQVQHAAPPPAPTWDPARGMYVDHLGQPLGSTPSPTPPSYPA